MNLDRFLLDSIVFRSKLLDAIMVLITKLGNLGLIWIVIAIILMFFKSYRKCGILILISLAINFLIGDLLIKNIVCRPRPFLDNNDITLLISTPLSYSFPSGHSSSSFAAAWTITKFNRILGFLTILLASLIAFSRIYLYVHYPSDVIVGIMLGIIVSQFTYIIFKRYIKFDVKLFNNKEK